MGLLASSRKFMIVTNNDITDGFRLDPEVAWNYGVNITQHFKLWKRDGTFSVDFYRTDFQNQVVIDLDNNPQEVLFYNLSGKSYSNSFQAQLDQEVLKNFEVRLAYRWYDVKTSFTKGLLEKPLLASHRAFMNLAYQTGKIWKFDFTVQWQSKKRIPYTASNPEQYRLEEYSPDFFLLNAQITKVFRKGVEIYVGMENIANYKQESPILASDMPYSRYFDSAMVWGPIFGRTTYAGFRYRIGKKESSDR
jgi:outer membrane receptor protein involved in Fe transport